LGNFEPRNHNRGGKVRLPTAVGKGQVRQKVAGNYGRKKNNRYRGESGPWGKGDLM